MKNSKWKRIFCCMLAVCLVGTLLLSNQSFGVFADETVTKHNEVSEAQDETGAEIQDETGSEADSVEDTNSIDENKVSAESEGVKENVEAEEAEITEETTAETAKEFSVDTGEVEPLAETVDISKLIDADIALLQWKTTRTDTTVTVGDTIYTVTDEGSYQNAYDAVYKLLISNATEVSEIAAQTIMSDTVWNISGPVNMSGDVNVNTGGRLVIVGNGMITRTTTATLIANGTGTVCLQGSVYLNGNEKAGTLVQLNSSGTGYITDDFHIGNSGSFGVQAFDDSSFYMSGGLIGTKKITFTWYSEDNNVIGTKTYDETLTYIQQNLDNATYDYIKDIDATDGNKESGLRLQSNAKFYMSGGVIAGNGGLSYEGNENRSGGGITAVGGIITMTDGIIIGNRTRKRDSNGSNGGSGGGINSGGGVTTNISGGMLVGNHSYGYAGGINSGGNLTLSENAVVAYNGSDYNGGAVLIAQKYTCTVKDNAAVVHNRAIGVNYKINNKNSGKGGAFRVVGTLDIQGGKICYNYGNGPLDSDTVEQDVGGAISGQTDMGGGSKDNPTARVATVNLIGGEIAYNKANGRGGAIWLVCAAEGYNATFSLDGTVIHHNEAKGVGGGIYFEAFKGTLTANLNSGQITDNKAEGNGGGMCFSLTSGKELTVNVGQDQADNKELILTGNKTSQTGGALCITRSSNSTGGSLNVNLNSGTFKNNTAKNGGALGIVRGNLNIYSGRFDTNTADENGGGAYISDGKVRMFGGDIIGNKAGNDGGGIYVSSESTAADVLIRSGNLKQNTAGSVAETDGIKGNGGAIAVESSETANRADKVVIGLPEEHEGLDVETHTFTPFDYVDAEDNMTHNHASCPVLQTNTAYGNGGGIYMSSANAELDIYCLEEKQNNSILNDKGSSVMCNGGTVTIGAFNTDKTGALGNTSINSSMLVSGGNVTLNGTTANPYFADDIIVNISENAGKFTDNRISTVEDIFYKIHYFENFVLGGADKPSGAYSAKQYKKGDKITAAESDFEHVGFKVIGWAMAQNATDYDYQIGQEISDGNSYAAWGENGYEDALMLYAIWSRISYTVHYEANASSSGYGGSMADQTFSYGITQALQSNGFTISGKRFTGWNTSADGTGLAYAADYDESKLSVTDGSTVKLYAQWKNCTHKEVDGANVTYTEGTDSNGNPTITESCDCGGHTVTVALSGATTYHDGKEHPAILSYTGGTLLEGTPSVTYTYSTTENGIYTEMQNGVPTDSNWYQASITLGGKTISVKYQIKDPSESDDFNVKAVSGEKYTEFTGVNNVNVAADMAFTVQYTYAGSLNINNRYNSAPILSFSAALPNGASVIMLTDDSYYYYKCTSADINRIPVTDFQKMGASGNYVYSAPEVGEVVTQKYQFVVDFSKAESAWNPSDLSVTLTYKDSNLSSDNKIVTAKIGFGSVADFSITDSDSGDRLTVNAPDNTDSTRWKDRQLLLVISQNETTGSNGKIPADAKLTVSVDGTTVVCQMNQNGEFLVPLSWKASQTVSLALTSGTVSTVDRSYQLNTRLYVAAKDSNNKKGYNTGKSVTASVKIAKSVIPSMQIQGTQDLIGLSGRLDITLSQKNLDDCVYVAEISKNNNTTYYTSNIPAGESRIQLPESMKAGSYCLKVTAKNKDGETSIMAVPYYFIVK